MTKLKILHLTDFHYKEDKMSIPNQNRLLDALSHSLKDQESKIDFIFFTGDLVNDGNNLDHFHKASEVLLKRIAHVLNIPMNNVIICEGNHDVNRGQELEEIAKSIDSLTTNKDLDNYIVKQDGKSFKASLKNFNNYHTFRDEFYSSHKEEKGDLIENLYSIHNREKGGVKISITTINSAWRSFNSEKDSGNLLYPTHLLKEAFEKIKLRSSFNIFLMHHPLSDLKYWNSILIEDIVFKDYHAMFSGHTHKNRDTIYMVPEIGMYHCSSSATLSLDEVSKIGYSIIEIDLETYQVITSNRIYQSDENTFYKGDPKISHIPISETKIKENKFRENIRKRFNEELIKANELFLSNNELKEGEDFIQLFTTPIIKDKPKTFDDTKTRAKSFSLNDLLLSTENEILFGKDKSGKTAILYKILLNALNNFSITKILPLYIDCKEYIKLSKSIDILKNISSFYALNKNNSANLSQSYHVKILLDNFDDNEIFILNPVNEYLSNNPNSSIIAVAEETLLNNFSNQYINNQELSNRFIWEIGRTEIRILTKKWPNLSDSKREVLLEKIHKVFNQLNIPSNYWTVSLFIWIFEKNSDANFRSNFQLIELYIDNLLGRDRFISKESIYKIDYEDFKTYIGELAYFLISKKSEENYVLSHVELINFTDNYKNSNRKFVIEVSKVTDLIIDLGLLKKVYMDSYTFRLNGVFEYFLAYYMKDNQDFRNKVIDDGHFYLSFANEFEICAGFNSRDVAYVKKILQKTIEIFDQVASKYNFTQLDSLLKYQIQNKLSVDLGLPKALKDTVKPIPIEEQDIIFEEISGDNRKLSEVNPKKYYKKIEPTPENLEKSLLIIARVFRNSKFKDQNLEDEIFELILNYTCVLGFEIIEEIEDDNLELIPEKTSEDELMKLLIQFVPIVIQTFFYDAVVQNNLESILIEKINTLKQKPKENELKLLILYFSLIDLNLKNNHKYIAEIIELLKIGVLKQTSLIT
ncbi:MAG: hypothetical protein GKR88_07190 [Flavobacteriaceae bacterium]|nr:MAG: hypothetical protein GKR88_07190 [Flavobacteriaceae bacterium]